MHRKELLENAITHTCGERDIEYGSPKENLANCAILWSAYLEAKYNGLLPAADASGAAAMFSFTAEDVAWLNVLQKIARTFGGSASPDTYEDAAAYAAIAGECEE